MTTELTPQKASALLRESPDSLIKHMMTIEQADCPVIHHFHDGVYIREVRFPTGALVVGHIQRFDQMNVFIRGAVRMLNADGSFNILRAPCTFVGKAGRKVGYVMEEVIWQNIYPNPDNERDIEVLEAKWLEQTPYFEDFKAQLLLPPPNDYPQMLVDLGVTDEQVTEESQDTRDQIPFPDGWTKVAVRKSPIHGRGIFAEANITVGELFCPARIDGCRTPAGRFTNHSGTPNTKAIRVNGDDIGWVALQDIHGRRGGFDGEEITVDYRQVYAVARGEAE